MIVLDTLRTYQTACSSVPEAVELKTRATDPEMNKFKPSRYFPKDCVAEQSELKSDRNLDEGVLWFFFDCNGRLQSFAY